MKKTFLLGVCILFIFNVVPDLKAKTCSDEDLKKFNKFIGDTKKIAQKDSDKALAEGNICEQNAQASAVAKLVSIEKNDVLLKNYCDDAISFCSNDKGRARENFEFFFFECRPVMSFGFDKEDCCSYFSICTEPDFIKPDSVLTPH